MERTEYYNETRQWMKENKHQLITVK